MTLEEIKVAVDGLTPEHVDRLDAFTADVLVEHVSAIEFLDVVLEAEENGLTEDDARLAHALLTNRESLGSLREVLA